jgi:hypothetical protein
MDSNVLAQKIADYQKKLKLIWTFISISIVLYLAVGNFIPVRTGIDESLLKMLPLLFGVIAVSTVGASFFIRKNFLSENKLNEKLFGSTPSDSPTEAALDATIAHLTTFTIVPWALYESIGVYGLVLAILGGPLWMLIVFCGVSLFLMLTNRPSAGTLLRACGLPA